MALTGDCADLGNAEVSHEQIVATISPKIQQLIVLPTEKCNFRCTYCYEDFKIGKMPEWVQTGLERFMDKRIPELSFFSLQWFGGEPLLAKSVVLRLSKYANDLCTRHGVHIAGSITTNAYLLEQALFAELVSYGQRFYQITLDGVAEDHDTKRRLANGGGTFERIWRNLVATRSVDEQFIIQMRIHARRDNRESLKTLVRQIAATFGDDPRYQMDFQHLRDLGGEGGKTVSQPLSIPEVRELERELRAEHAAALQARRAEAGLTPHDALPAHDGLVAEIIDGPRREPVDICYAAKPNSLLIRADGRVGKCTVALTDDRNTVGTLNADGTVTIDSERLKPWIRGLSTLDVGELSCPLGGMYSG
jgi:uncharacterized protein